MSLSNQEELPALVFDETPQNTIEELPALVFDEATPVAPEAVESNAMWDLVEDTAKQTLVDNALAVIPNSILNMFQGRAPDMAIIGSPEEKARLASDRAVAAETMGLDVKNIQPKTVLEQVVANVVRAGGDPTSYIGGVGFNTVTKMTTAAIESAVSTAAGTLGSEAASQGAVSLGAEAGGNVDIAARTIGGALGGVAPAASVTGIAKATGAASKVAFNLKDKIAGGPEKAVGELGKGIAEGEMFVATSQVSNFIDSALRSDPTTATKINEVEAVLADFPDIDVGPWVAMTDNPVFRDNLDYLLKTNPEFHGTLKTQLKNASEVIQARKESLYPAEGYKAEKSITKELDKGADSARKVIKNVDKAIQAASAPLSSKRVSTPQRLGRVYNALIERKQKAVSALMSPKYKTLFKQAEDNGVSFSSENTSALYSFATQEAKELFGVMPRTYGEVITKWKPVVVRDANGKPLKGPDGKVLKESPEVSLRELDSFKKEINKGLRNSNIQGDSRVRLQNIKNELSTQINNMGDFGARYKGLDLEYWQLVGMPLNKDGLKDMSSKKFDEQVAPVLTKPQQARQFLDSVGDMGKPVIRAAVYSDASKSVYNDKTGEVDFVALDKYVNSPLNREIIDLAGMRSELGDMGTAIRNLDESRVAQSTKYVEGSRGHARELFGRLNERGLDGVVLDILSSPSKTGKHLEFVKGLSKDSQDIVMTGLRGEMASVALRSGDGAMNYIKNNERAFDDVFGKGMYEDLKSLTEMKDLFGSLSLDKIKIASKQNKLQDILMRKTGVPLTQVNSILRDRIMSGFQKVFVVMNKMNSSRIDANEEQIMINLFSQRGVLKEIKDNAEYFKLNINKPEALTQFTDSINKTISRGAYMGVEAVKEDEKREQRGDKL